MKKYLLINSAIIAFCPVLASVACAKTTQPSHESKSQSMLNPSIKPKPVLPFTTQVNDDSIWFTNNDYHEGALWNGTLTGGSPIKVDFAKLSPVSDTFSYDNVVLLGDGDAFYVAFDNDDQDGLSINNFENNFVFCDSSYSHNTDLDDINKAVGNEIYHSSGGWYENWIHFANGKLNPWYGSQSNHGNISFDEAMANAKATFDSATYTALETYYASHSHVFVPVTHNQGFFTYEKVSDNIMKITFHYDNAKNNNPVTQAIFKFVKRGAQQHVTNFSPFSLGTTSEWEAYANHPEATYFALKNKIKP